MGTQKVIFTLLPNGARTDSMGHLFLKASVFISPRLTTASSNGQLSEFPGFSPPLGGWPNILNGVNKIIFKVAFEDSQGNPVLPAPIHAATTTVPALDNAFPSNTWTELFPPKTYVKEYQFDNYPNLNILSFQVRGIVSFLTNQYLGAATKAAQTSQAQTPSFPLRSDLQGFSQIAPPFHDATITSSPPPMLTGTSESNVIAKIRSILFDGGAGTARSLFGRGAVSTQDYQGLPISANQFNFEQAKLFFDPYAPAFQQSAASGLGRTRQFVRPNASTQPRRFQIPNIDFHRMVSSCSQYPALMRLLGLVVDLEVHMSPEDAGNLVATRRGLVYLVLENAPTGWVTPKTHFTFSSSNLASVPQSAFVATPRPATSGGSDIVSPGFPFPSQLLALGVPATSGGNFDVVQVDADSAAIKTLDFANNVVRLFNGTSTTTGQPLSSKDTPQALSLPSLKTGGISVIRADRAFHLANTLLNAQQNNDDLPTTPGTRLYADDLVRGYRPDVFDTQTGKWYSLCRRVGTYNLNGTTPVVNGLKPLLNLEDEGWISMGVAQAPNPNNDPNNPTDPNNPDMRLHESIFTWAGWGLAAPRPQGTGEVLNEATGSTPSSWIANYDSNQALGSSNNQWGDTSTNQLPSGLSPHWNLAVSFDARGLPRLRYGNKYFLRARTVDLAGNSHHLGDVISPIGDVMGSHPWLTAPVVFSRFEPVQAPLVLLLNEINPKLPETGTQQESPGESLARLVIRSNYGKDSMSYNYDLSKAFNGVGWIFQPQTTRLIGPPQTGEAVAELHGTLDDSTHTFNPDAVFQFLNIDSYTGIKNRDKGVYDAPYDTTHQMVPYKDRNELQLPKFNPNPVIATDLTVHYLPDPIARGLALLFLDANGNPLLTSFGTIPGPLGQANPLLIPFYPNNGPWPEAQLISINLRAPNPDDGTAVTISYDYDSSTKSWNIRFPRGQTFKVRASCYVWGDPTRDDPTDDTQSLGIMNWAKQSPQYSTLLQLATSGQFWMVTPYREITLVHAVQQPILAPSLQGVPQLFPGLSALRRNLGETFATLTGAIRFDGQSTSRLDVLAAWEDTVDNPALSLPNDGKPYGNGQMLKKISRTSHVFELSQLNNPLAEAIILTGTLGTFPAQKHEFHDTNYRIVRYTAVATTRFSEYFPLHTSSPIIVPGLCDPPSPKHYGICDAIVRYSEVAGNAEVTDNAHWALQLPIPSSARPDKPKVLYVIPTFLWDRPPPPTPPLVPPVSLSSTRSGGGLRVYIDRPWYSSGDGELLGILLWPGQGLIPPDSLAPYVTNWGQDPLWASSGLQQLTASNFSEMSESTNPATVSLAETGDKVMVLPYDVNFDPDRKLWYADVQVVLPRVPPFSAFDSAPYFPFIRLALARYQPNSILNAELSPVSAVGYSQLTSNRALNITQDPTNPSLMHVTVHGNFPQNQPPYLAISTTPGPPLANQIQVIVQTRDPNVPDPDLGWQTTSSQVWLSSIGPRPVTTYQGQIPLPPPPPGQSPPEMRLLIAEYELHQPFDFETQDRKADLDPILQPLQDYRLVYAEAVRIPREFFAPA